MKILIVHQYYLMPGYGGGARFNEMARMWSEQGHHVTVIAGAADYCLSTTPPRYRRRWVTKERDGAVTVYRCSVPGSYGKDFLGRKVAFLGFTLSASTAALMAGRHDVVIATSPPLLVAIPGWIAARVRLKPVPWIFEVCDLWPESAITTGVVGERSLLARILYRLEALAYRSAERINVLTPAIRKNIEKRGLAAAEKICFVPNGADVEIFPPGPRDNAARREFGWGDRFVALYAGAHGLANSVGQLVDAAERLRRRTDILIACVGTGPQRNRLQAEARARGLTNIMFHGQQPRSRMPDVVNASDAGVAVLQKNPTFRTVYPNKVFDYMSCAKPVVLAIDGVAREMVCERAEAGLFVEPEDPDGMARTICRLADHPELGAELGGNGRRWVVANASRASLAARYLEVMKDLVEEGHGAKAGSPAAS